MTPGGMREATREEVRRAARLGKERACEDDDLVWVSERGTREEDAPRSGMAHRRAQ